MKNIFRATMLLFAGAIFSSAVLAADIKDGRAIVTPEKEGRYTIDNFTFGKAELFGYLSDLKDTRKITGIVLKSRRGKPQASDEQLRAVASIGSTLELEAFVQHGKELVPIAPEP